MSEDILKFPAGSGPDSSDAKEGPEEGFYGEQQSNEEMILEAIISMAKPANEMKEAIEDLPLQIETLSRVLLARQFIYANNGNFDFHRTAYENVWAQITNGPE